MIEQTNKTEARVRLRVPFHHVDPMQVVWHGHYLKYFEAARQALFDGVGVDFYRFKGEGYFFPVVRAAVKYKHSLHFRDEIECVARLVELQSKAVIQYEIRRVSDGLLCAQGRSEQVAVRAKDMSLELLMPDEVRRAFDLD